MTGNDQHCFGDKPQSFAFDDARRKAKGFSRSDAMRDVGVAGTDDAPDDAFLVRVEVEDGTCAREPQVGSVERAWDDVVIEIVVDANEPIGPFFIRPDPRLEGAFDLVELL